jgi:hypothetical protein
MSRPAKHTPESVAAMIGHKLYVNGIVHTASDLARAEGYIVDVMREVWPTRKPKAKKAEGQAKTL